MNPLVQLSKQQSPQKAGEVWRFAAYMSLHSDVVPKMTRRWRMLLHI